MEQMLKQLAAAALGVLLAGGVSRGAGIPAGAPLQMEGLVVTATRTPLRPEQVASAVTVISRGELARSGARDLAALLETVPSLDVSRAGGPGGTATLRIRGMGDGQALLLIDGVEQNDPASPGRAVDLATLCLDEVERVEIVRGPQSALYGADAMGGVVQVFTRPIAARTRLGLSTGSLGQRALQAGLARRAGSMGASLSLGHERLEGFSASRDALGEDADGLVATRGRLALDWQPRADLDLELSAAAERSRMELDNFGGQGGDDPNSEGETRRRSLSLRGEWRTAGGVSEWRLWRQDTRRSYDNPADAAHPAQSLAAWYDGRISHAGLQHARPLGGGHEALAALEWEGERGESRSHTVGAWGPWDESFAARQVTTTALILQDRWSAGPFTLTAGGRQDWHGALGDRATGRLAAGWALAPGALLRGSLGTGFKAPSLYQLHSAYGDPALAAERSRGWDLGLDWRAARAHASLGWFRNDVRDQIDFAADGNGGARYLNVGRAVSYGLEAEAGGAAASWLDWSARLQRQETVDGRSGEDLLRRPRLLARLALDARRGRGALGAAWRWEGPRADLYFDNATYASTRVELDGFALLDLRASWQGGGVGGWLALENALDRQHEEILGYRAPGRGWRLGLDWSL